MDTKSATENSADIIDSMVKRPIAVNAVSMSDYDAAAEYW